MQSMVCSPFAVHPYCSSYISRICTYSNFWGLRTTIYGGEVHETLSRKFKGLRLPLAALISVTVIGEPVTENQFFKIYWSLTLACFEFDMQVLSVV